MLRRALYRLGISSHQSRSRRCLSHFRVVEHVVPASYGRTYPGAIGLDAEASLRLAVKQYIPCIRPQDSQNINNNNAVTIIGGHANGFPKEVYEPLWDDLYEELELRGQCIQSIWIADNAHQGQSGRLNETVLGNDPNWWDHARDVLFLINQQQEHMPQPLIGVGHSMGGSILTALALLHPSLLQSLVLIDPVIQTENPSKQFAPPSTYRRDRWPSYAAAREAFGRSKFYQSWDHRVLENWLRYGLRNDRWAEATTQSNEEPSSKISDSPTATLKDRLSEESKPSSRTDPVILVTTKAQEVFHYLRPLYKAEGGSNHLREKIYPDVNKFDLEEGYQFYRPEPAEVFRQLPHLRPSVLYCFGQSSPLATPDLRRKKLQMTGTGLGGSGGVAARRVKEVVFDTGHMLPFQQPRQCARTAADWMVEEINQWQTTRDEWRQRWTNTQGKSQIDCEWLRRIPKPEKVSKPE